MAITYDRAKSARNEELRGISFERANHFNWSTALVAEDKRKDYEEVRYQALGEIERRLHMLVFTPRGIDVHVISLRKANARERRRYASQSSPRTDRRRSPGS